MRISQWRSRLAILGAIGCFLMLTFLSFGKMRVLAQSVPTQPSITSAAIIAQTAPAQAPDLAKSFSELGLEGSILIYDSNNQQTY